MSNFRKIKIVLGLALSAFVLLVVFGFKDKETEKESIDNVVEKVQEKITIAACPTCLELAGKLDKEKYQVIPTVSTSESVELIKNKQADLILAGRTLRPEEPNLEGIIIKEGYSFIGDVANSVYEDELKKYNIYTDLDVDLIKRSFPVDQIEKVEDVYQYLSKGIVITSWENTDYSKAGIIHLLDNDGARVKLSRQPTLYCSSKCDADLITDITSVL